MKNKLELGREYPLLGEEDAICQITKISRELLQQDQELVRRQQHARHHGCVKGEFIVEANLPEKIRFGIFKQPKRYTAWIRFSNASGNAQQPDSKADVRGMAIKLTGVEGEKLLAGETKTQDFVMINHPVFFIRNLQDYVELFNAVQEAKGKPPLKFFFPGLNPYKWRLHELMISRSMRSKKVDSPLATQYWSTTPFKLGPAAIKFFAKPSLDETLASPVSRSDNYLQEIMVKHLETREACFNFFVQFQTDPYKMPVEDPSIEWDEQLSPPLKVATIRISPQVFNTPEQMKFCEDLSYTPWHSLPDHRPLGGINRARRQVYEAISRVRHELNNAPLQEPTGEEVFPGTNF